jgi:hypothetical protein
MLPYAIAALGYVHGTNKVKGYKTNSLYTTAFMGSAFGFLISKAAALKPMPTPILRYGLPGTVCLIFIQITSSYGMGYYIGKSHLDQADLRSFYTNLQ